MGKTDIKSLDYGELQEFLKTMGEKAFRAKQIYQWMHEKQAESFEEMTNLSKEPEREAERELYLYLSGAGGDSDFGARRNTEISLPPGRRKCGRKCADEV